MCGLIPYQSVYWEVSILARSSSCTIICVYDMSEGEKCKIGNCRQKNFKGAE